MFKTQNPLMTNIEIIAEAMNYEEDPFIRTGSEYYFTWTNKTEEDIAAIFEKTGVKCTLTKDGTLLVPEYDNFKSEREKELLLDLSQYGDVMMYLNMSKKCSKKELQLACKELFSILHKKCNEEDFHSLLKSLINKIS